ncbi:MAG: hypothetical protein ABI162_15880 [Luteolibacter sp.]
MIDPIFSKLLDNGRKLPAGELQRQVFMRFPQAVQDAGFELAVPGTPFPSDRLVIGVGTYVSLEMVLLDRIREKVLVLPIPEWEGKIFVFDMLSCASNDDIEELVPGVGRVLQTPVVGLWQGGMPLKSVCGWQATRFLCQLFGIEVE